MSSESTSKRHYRIVLLLVALLILLVGVAWFQQPDGRMHVYMLQTSGDALLIQTPGGRFVLLDGGGDASQLTLVLGQLLPFWQRELHTVILTTPSGRHIGGQVAAMARYQPVLALAPPELGRSGAAGEWRRLAAQGTLRPLAAGQRLELDGASLMVLEVTAGEQGGAVLLLSYGATRVLFHTGGSAGDSAALALVGRPLDLLVYPWQRNPALMSELRPRAMFMSESYSAPSPVLLSFAERRRFSPQVFHPKADGQLQFTSDGRRVTLKSEG
ncbi:hypothetical protein CJ255_16755 [Candidatus Viridilinea mediisalina]|uniref:Metallo-beta-lactamase domain-containing protein n=2 Tax=Candidatus Viridilinea mediisalina TaxID=2024553 RepID=A0A2A6RFW9_9CHLR|nr:hypothetical protein CJ255_16755 [Candidatus Viridilinea mediisalina]